MNPLTAIGYAPPLWNDIALDIVTPTYNRPKSLTEQAERLGPNMGILDRWIVVDDAGATRADVAELHGLLSGGEPSVVPGGPLLHLAMSYEKDDASSINRARHLGCSMARRDAWIVELDDHDILMPETLAAIRQNIASGYVFLYGDSRAKGPDGMLGDVQEQQDYEPWLMRDSHCPSCGVRAYPKRLYDAAGGYRWDGRVGDVDGNEYPGGDAMLQIRMEQVAQGQGFARIPIVLCYIQKCVDSISISLGPEQETMARRGRAAAKNGELS